MTTSDILILCAAGMLVTAYLMVGQKALFTAIRLYGVQSLLLALVAATIAISEARHELFVTAALTMVLKAILIPWFLMRVDRSDRHPPRDRAVPERPGVAAGLPRPDGRRLPRQHRDFRRARAASATT